MDNGSALLTLEDAHDEALRGWPADSFEAILDGAGFDDAGIDEHARARVEDASPYGLLGQLQGAGFGLADSPSLAVTLDLLRAADRLASWMAAQRARLISRIHDFSDADHRAWSGTKNSLVFTETVTETAALLKLSEGAAARLISESLSLVESLPNTLTALENGRICPTQAAVIVEQSRTLPDEAVRAFEVEILRDAADLNRPRLTARCRRLREKLHPETLTARRVKAQADRCVVFEPDRDGMAWLSTYLPAEQALTIHTALDATARNLRSEDDPRTLPQLRADVLADILLGAGDTTGMVPDSGDICRCGSTEGSRTGQGARSPSAKIVVTVPVFSLMRLTDEPAELEGYGPIPADAARRLAADATSWLRLLTHPYTGAVLGLDRTRYRPSEDLRMWVRLRERTCSFYGCSRPASRCELDHLTPWAGDGATSEDNLYPLCRRHHMLKHQTDWTPTPDPGGGLNWLSPGGRTYTTPSEAPPSNPGAVATTRILRDLDASMRTEPTKSADPPPF